MEKNCFNCRYFNIWDGDPCCLSIHGWKHILPCIYPKCTEFEERLPKSIDYRLVWNNVKKEFFNRYAVKPELAKRYLQFYPEDKNLINIEDENSKTKSSN